MTNTNSKTKTYLVAVTLAAITLAFSPLASLGDQTAAEHATAGKNNATRTGKKSVNRVKEALCNDSDAECAAKKAAHRIEEGGRYMGDKAKEGADKIDNDKKSND